ncbi:flagellar basal body-associated protein FliL [Duganella sp. 1411]|jgi:hypothetical protein|uniref:hypothetical protein n=1 Tax=Duganella sp. 1411 TaxID=2806572 RepID=UPI001AE91C17|nr:hypothetical protein [Duganella sp. 1411]MBP1203707.1 flagellar basal body-associated protein FliL [Duganella sp. 1411]
MNANSDKDYIDAKTEATRAGLDGRLAAFEENVNGKFAAIDMRFVALETKMEAGFAQIRAEFKEAIERATSQMVKWMVGICIVMFTIFFSSMVFFLNSITQVRQAQPLQALPPIVIQLPPLTAAPVAPPKPG